MKIDLSSATATHPFVLTDGSHESTYNPNMYCRWELIASQTPAGTTLPAGVILSFPRFDVEGSGSEGDTSKDYLKVEWKDHTGTSKTKILSGSAIPDQIEITGDHSEATPEKVISVTFNSDGNDERHGFLAISKAVPQRQDLLDITWSGCECDGERRTHDGKTDTGCANIPDGRAICVVKAGTCRGDKPWPPSAPVNVFRRPRDCQFPFFYRGEAHNDCITTDGNNGEPWCSAFTGIPFRLTVVGRRRFLASPRMEALTFSKRTFTLITVATCVRTQLAVHTV